MKDRALQTMTRISPSASQGKMGDRAQLRFSRHDKELLAVTFNAGMKDMDVAEQEAEDFAKRAEEYLRQHPDAQTYEE